MPDADSHQQKKPWLGQLTTRLWDRFCLGWRTWGTLALELAVITIGVILVGSELLNFNPRLVPIGRELGSAIQTHHIWSLLKQCGLCALWNGFERGGYPAFVDTYGSMLHPLVAITTLFFGVVNGVKFTLLLALWFAGLAQWWLAREMGLSWVSRMWSGLMAIFGGHLAGRMELGVFGVILSVAMASLVFPAFLRLLKQRTASSVVLFAITLASAILAGQGYNQIGLLASGVVLAWLLFLGDFRLSPAWKQVALGIGLALLLSAPFLVPLIHFLPNIGKDIDPTFRTAQPLAYLPLNLVINDVGFFQTSVLAKLPYPALYMNYIGWLPVGLAIFGLSVSRREDRKRNFVFAGAILMIYLLASAVLLRWMVKIVPSLAGVRHPTLIAGLAVPLILALAAYGLEQLITWPWPRLSLVPGGSDQATQRTVSLVWLLVIPVFFGLRSSYRFSRSWYITEYRYPALYNLLEGLRTPDLQWVEPPFGEHHYIEPAIAMGLKLSPGIMAWNWKEQAIPKPRLEASRSGTPTGDYVQIAEIDGIPIYISSQEHYAAVQASNNQQPCSAQGAGGFLTVQCSTEQAGRLIVKEHMWCGWKASRDGNPVSLIGDQWLEAEAPPGEHTYTFRYLPWDVPLGIFLALIGLGIGGYLCLRGGVKQGVQKDDE